MRPRLLSSESAGFTLTEIMVASSILLIVSTGVFVGLSYFAVMSSQDALFNDLRYDVLLTMDAVRRDINLSTNVVPMAGTRVTDNTTLVLRKPVQDAAGNVVVDSFEYVVYVASRGQTGLVREIWPDVGASGPSWQRVLNEAIVAAGFTYSGRPISQVDNLTTVRDVGIILVSARETGLRSHDAEVVEMSQFLDAELIGTLLRLEAPFHAVRYYIDYVNAHNLSVAIDGSSGAATMRNRRALGLITMTPPLLPS